MGRTGISGVGLSALAFVALSLSLNISSCWAYVTPTPPPSPYTVGVDTCPGDFLYLDQFESCYLVVGGPDEERNQDDAAAYCAELGAGLAILETSVEADNVGPHLRQGHYHVVAGRRDPGGEFKWNSETVLEPSHPSWAKDHPKQNRDCVAMVQRRGHTNFYSVKCTAARSFVCEVPANLVRIDDGVCASSPCVNGGQCRELGDEQEYYCHCPDRFTGQNCDIDMDPCADMPCENGGECESPQIGDYQCMCAEGFNGQNCEINIDDCASAPCLHEGSCEDLVASYRCYCMGHYTGDNCEIDVSYIRRWFHH